MKLASDASMNNFIDLIWYKWTGCSYNLEAGYNSLIEEDHRSRVSTFWKEELKSANTM